MTAMIKMETRCYDNNRENRRVQDKDRHWRRNFQLVKDFDFDDGSDEIHYFSKPNRNHYFGHHIIYRALCGWVDCPRQNTPSADRERTKRRKI